MCEDSFSLGIEEKEKGAYFLISSRATGAGRWVVRCQTGNNCSIRDHGQLHRYSVLRQGIAPAKTALGPGATWTGKGHLNRPTNINYHIGPYPIHRKK